MCQTPSITPHVFPIHHSCPLTPPSPQFDDQGAVVRLPNEAGRYGVRLEGQKEPMSLHGRNMRPYLELCPLGVSLACLRSFAAEFHPLLKGALKGEMCGGLTLAQALESIVRPITEGAGASLAQVLNEVGAKDEANRPLAEKATLFVIAAPNDRFENVLEAVSGYLAKHDKPEDVYIWLNLFSQNAHCKVEASRRLITLGPPSNHTSNHTLITSHHTFSPHTLTTHSHHTLSPHTRITHSHHTTLVSRRRRASLRARCPGGLTRSNAR